MELTTYRPNTLTTDDPSQKPWAVAIRNTYGSIADVTARFSPNMQRYCANNMRRAIERNTPTFGQMIAAYGERNIAVMLVAHISATIIQLGEDRDVDEADAMFTAENMCENDSLRILRFSTIIGIFHRIKSGEYEMYGKVTPRKIGEAVNKYAAEMKRKEERIFKDLEREENARQRAKDAAEAISFEQYAAENGISERTITEYFYNRMQEQTKNTAENA